MNEGEPEEVAFLPPAPILLHGVAGVAAGLITPVEGWSMLTAVGAGSSLGLVFDICGQLAWNFVNVQSLLQQRHEKADEKAEGENSSMGIALPVRPSFMVVSALCAGLVVLVRCAYQKEHLPNPLADFADARSLRMLERRVDEQQRAIQVLEQEVASLRRQREP